MVVWAAGAAARSAFSLPPQDFHITLGFRGHDVHGRPCPLLRYHSVFAFFFHVVLQAVDEMQSTLQSDWTDDRVRAGKDLLGDMVVCFWTWFVIPGVTQNHLERPIVGLSFAAVMRPKGLSSLVGGAPPAELAWATLCPAGDVSKRTPWVGHATWGGFSRWTVPFWGKFLTGAFHPLR